MYEKVKTTINGINYRYAVIGVIVFISIFCIWYIFHEPTGSNDNDTINAVERAQEQQRKSLELNRDIQYSIDRSSKLSREAKERVDRSTQYNQQIGERIDASQASINEARNYLKRNAELFDRVERESRERQSNNQETQDATQPISDGRSGGNHWSGNTSMNER